MAAEEMRRAVIGQLPSSLPHCINAHMLTTSHSGLYSTIIIIIIIIIMGQASDYCGTT